MTNLTVHTCVNIMEFPCFHNVKGQIGFHKSPVTVVFNAGGGLTKLALRESGA